MAERVIRDPIYGYIPLRVELAELVDSRLFQRLRRIAQTSLTNTVYPASTGSRLEHSFGVMYLAARGWRSAWQRAEPKTRDDFLSALQESMAHDRVQIPTHANQIAELVERAVSAVALLHDVGHPPFSHALESLYARLARAEEWLRYDVDAERELLVSGAPFHEFAGVLLMRRMVRKLPEPLHHLTQVIYEADPKAETWESAVHSIVVAEIDVDRLDYLMRDARKAGTEFGAIDYERLIDALELHITDKGFAIAPGVRARSAVETLVVQRAQSYKWITFHPRVVGANLALTKALEELIELTTTEAKLSLQSERETTVAELFGPLRPNLNYLAPGEGDLARTIGVILGTHLEGSGGTLFEEETRWPRLDLDAQDVAAIRDELRVEVQASVDDAAVLNALKQASLLARVLLRSASFAEADPVRRSLDRLVTLVHAALYRRKVFLPLWKTVEEFSAVASALVEHELITKTEEAFAEVRLGLQDKPELHESFYAEEANTLALLRDDPMSGVNHLFTVLLKSDTQHSLFCAQLGAVKHTLLQSPGFWEVAYTGFQPIRTAGALTVLYRDDDAKPLLQTSPMVQALTRVEEQRSRVAVFFFLLGQRQVKRFDRDQLHDAQADLIGTFVESFPQFARITLPEAVAAGLSG